MKKIIKRILSWMGITPYVYYTFKYNYPLRAQRSLVQSNKPIIFDVGAFDGRTVDAYKKCFDSCLIYSFEPTASSFNLLESKYRQDPDVKLYNLALADNEGVREFFINQSGLTNSLLNTSEQGKKEFPQAITKEKVDVKVGTIDTICGQANLDRIDILKIDVQGGELDVLRGAMNMLRNGRIKQIYLEVEFFELYKSQPLFHAIAAFLYEFNYELYSLYNISYSKEGRMLYGDALFHLSQEIKK